MKTGDLWDVMNEIRSTRSRTTKKRVVNDLYSSKSVPSVYWSFRFLVGSPLEGWDDDLGVGKKTVRKAAERAFGIQYKEIRNREKELGNLSEVFVDIEENETLTAMKKSEEVSVSRLGEDIQEIANVSSGTSKINIISELFETRANPQVVSFAILNDISLGISSKTLMQMLADKSGHTREGIDRAYGIQPDVSRLAKRLKEGKGLRMDVQPGDRIKPQLASSKDLPKYEGAWMAQYKYDGARVLIHSISSNDNFIIKAFTRQQNNVTGNLPELSEVDFPDKSFVVDGEAVAYGPDTGEPLPFQKIMERFQREKNIEEKRKTVEVKFKLFDILYWDGEDLTKRPLKSRLNTLSDNFEDELLAETDFDIDTAYENALNLGHEGIIVKNVEKEYVFDRDKSWRKLKPVKEPVDLTIVDVKRGTGRMSDMLGAIVVQTADGVDVGRVGTGFTDSDRVGLWNMHQEDELIGSTVEVEFEELQIKDDSYGLRFPRFSCLRPDGEPDTLERLKEL